MIPIQAPPNSAGAGETTNSNINGGLATTSNVPAANAYNVSGVIPSVPATINSTMATMPFTTNTTIAGSNNEINQMAMDIDAPADIKIEESGIFAANDDIMKTNDINIAMTRVNDESIEKPNYAIKYEDKNPANPMIVANGNQHQDSNNNNETKMKTEEISKKMGVADVLNSNKTSSNNNTNGHHKKRKKSSSSCMRSFTNILLDEQDPSERSGAPLTGHKVQRKFHVDVDSFLGLSSNPVSLSTKSLKEKLLTSPAAHSMTSPLLPRSLTNHIDSPSPITTLTTSPSSRGLIIPAPQCQGVVAPPSSTSSPGEAITIGDTTFYEGFTPLSLPEDHIYLSDLLTLTRQWLELFSATEVEIMEPKPGRRAALTRGKVGIRCIACRVATSTLSHSQSPQGKPPSSASSSLLSGGTGGGETKRDRRRGSAGFVTGSVSYPASFQLLYPICSQKPSLHFQKCTNLPPTVRQRFHDLLNNHKGGRGNRVSNRSSGGGVPGVTPNQYFVQCAERMGIVEVKGGLRFGRDPSLPLPPPSATIDMQSLVRPERKPIATVLPEGELVHPHDADHVTPYVYLLLHEMLICRASIQDIKLSGRTKSVREGFAGFCCKGCQRGRFFPTKENNLNSAVNNAFYQHVIRCDDIDKDLKAKITSASKMHNQELQLLERGSQTKFYKVLWGRLRLNDKDTGDEPPSGMMISTRGREPKSPFLDVNGGGNTDATGTACSNSLLSTLHPFLLNTAKKMDICHVAQYDIMERGGLNHTQQQMTQLPIGYTGIVCRYCNKTKIDLRTRFFPQTPELLRTAMTFSLYNHFLQCKLVTDTHRKLIQGHKAAYDKDIEKIKDDDDKFLAHVWETLRQKDKINVDAEDVKKETDTAAKENISNGGGAEGIKKETDDAQDNAKNTGSITTSNTTTKNTSSSPDKPTPPLSHNFAKLCTRWYTCRSCYVIPLPLRAAGALLPRVPNLHDIEIHTPKCKGCRFDLTNVKTTVDLIIQTLEGFDKDVFLGSDFRSIVGALLNGNERLMDKFTIGVYEEDTTEETEEDKAIEEGLWKELAMVGDINRDEFEKVVGGFGKELLYCDFFWDYVRILAPQL